MSIKIEALIARKIGFASHQNAVPLVRELSIWNQDEQSFQDLVLTLGTDPAFVETRTWHIDRLFPGDRLSINERDIKLNAGYLAELSESLGAEVVLRLSQGNNLLVEQRFPTELLARTEWGGLSAMPELLAAFCMPNDPAVDRVLKAASEVLRRAGKKDGIDGYESKSRTRTWELASAIWSGVCSFKLSYALPPASFEQQGQKIRPPSMILENGVATCLDTALLFAGALEQAGLNALLIMTKGHAFTGVWLQPQEFSQLLTDDASAVRKRLDLKEMVVFETTLATQVPTPSFSQAVTAAERQLDDDQFIMAIDLHRARMQKIRPLALAAGPEAPVETDDTPPAAEGLEEAPALPGFDVEISEGNEGPAGKLTLWQRKLLDLTTRNRLLHLPDSAKGVRLLCADPAALEDLLSSGQRIRVVSVPDLKSSGRDIALYEQQNHESLINEVARQALARGEVLASLEKSKLEATLIELFRKARSDLEEGGANTLFLAIGFLKWKKSAEDPKVYSAPLILLPVKLERKSALSGVTLSLLDEEPRFNLTLLELLRHDFELIIPGLDGELPSDESGIDVMGIWNMVRRAVRDVPGFEVSTELVLGTFSFAKYLMWKDLNANAAQLLQSPLVKHLLERDPGGEGFSGSDEFPRPERLDATVTPAELFTPLPADSSQLSAVVASAGNHSFVLDGPPGTGKSQTIANMIAHNLALGRRVLFVAEKRAALDVVYRRLAEKGLGEFCLELHSSKASKVEVLKQLDRAWDVRDALSAEDWEREAARLQTLRTRLNQMVEVLHRRWRNGLSLHQAIGRVVRDHGPLTPRLMWPTGTEHDAAEYGLLLDISRRLGLNGSAARDLSSKFGALAQTQWSNAWQAQIASASRELPQALDALNSASERLIALTQLSLPVTEVTHIQQLNELATLLGECHGLNLSFAFAPDTVTRIDGARRACQLIENYRELEEGLSLTYADEACRRIPFEAMHGEWQEAEGKFWFLATFAKKKVARHLASVGGATGLPDTLSDLAILERLHTHLLELDTLSSDVQSMPGWQGLASDTARTLRAVTLAERLRSKLSMLAESPDHLISLRSAVARLVIDANDMLAAGDQIGAALSTLQLALSRYDEAVRLFAGLAATSSEMLPNIAALRATSVSIQQQEEQLKAWCDWCRVREQASEAGLANLAQALEEGGLLPSATEETFVTAYAYWFATQGIDGEPLLRTFVAAEHMSDIAAFNRLDDELAKLTVRYIRAKLCGLIPSKNDIPKSSGFAILKHELQKSRRHKPVRQLAIEMGDALNRLAPCMLMSPLSIAQFLPADQPPFDLVIFDEASQIAPWDAIGSIARGRQVVIAGDPRQMPPTNFFNRGANAGDDDTAEDMESILDECLGAGVPSHSLSWHYRSRHESLIAFSNHRYYDSNLITFPAAETRASAVEWRRVEGVYAKGKGRYNQAEAEAIVNETVKRLTDPAFIAAGLSIGIITLNSDQQKLINDLLDAARKQYPQIEPFFEDGQTEPVVVKNLETVQGDERDLIMLGIGYGPTEAGSPVMSMNFGPLNKDGGWRRLNVAITRSRREMLVFSSFDPSMIDLNRTNARAVRDLKHFIEFAQRGPRALAEAVQGSVGGYDSPFEEAVAQGLRRLGWQVVPQIGVSRFRIDLGIVHPDRPGDYLAGVECDGATYHSAATARDRDKVRGAILRGLGWDLVRLWSTEWWVDKEGALQRLHAALNNLLAHSRIAPEPGPISEQLEAAPPVIDFLRGIEVGDTLPEAQLPLIADIVPEAPEIRISRSDNERPTPAAQRGEYRVANLSSFATMIEAEQFHLPAYTPVLRQIIEEVLRQEAPMLDALLVQRIARAHGFQRSGRLIRDRVLELAEQHHHVQQAGFGEVFVWHAEDDVLGWSTYRIPVSANDARSIEEIAAEELRIAAAIIDTADPALEVARLLGVKRLTGSARERIERILGA
jgi:very-short-patch-repair endonuclease